MNSDGPRGRKRRVITERRRSKVVKVFVLVQILVCAALASIPVVAWLFNGAPSPTGAVATTAVLLTVWGVTSYVTLTAGLIGIYLPWPVAWKVLGIAGLAALISGFAAILLGLFTTPLIVVIALLARSLVIRVQRTMLHMELESEARFDATGLSPLDRMPDVR